MPIPTLQFVVLLVQVGPGETDKCKWLILAYVNLNVWHFQSLEIRRALLCSSQLDQLIFFGSTWNLYSVLMMILFFFFSRFVVHFTFIPKAIKYMIYPLASLVTYLSILYLLQSVPYAASHLQNLEVGKSEGSYILKSKVTSQSGSSLLSCCKDPPEII